MTESLWTCRRCGAEFIPVRRNIRRQWHRCAACRRVIEQEARARRKARSVEKGLCTRCGCQKATVPPFCDACRRKRKLERINVKFGLPPDAYEKLETEADGRCLICHQVARLDLDHDHETGVIRGLICNPCNRALYIMRDDPDRLTKAAAYVARFRCEQHPHVRLRCPACTGQEGGKSKSPQKLKAVRENAKKGGRPKKGS